MSAAPARDEAQAPAFDLLRLPVVGTLLRRPATRTAARLFLLALALLMVLQGWFGSQLGPKNLSTLLTWVHYRGLLVLALLIAGNVFCYSCPMVLFRDLLRRFFHPALAWPRRLRNKWTAVALFAGVLYLYELFDLWGDPWLTAWLIAGYFVVASVVDVLFRGASFCKYLCPVGQFNFLSSTVSPLEVTVRDRDVCAGCKGKECIAGAAATLARPAQRGCELALFQPRKVGNLDCTFCLDCVYACPYENVGIFTRVPGAELAEPGPRSGVGRPAERPDLAFLATLFAFGALLNVFGMVSPVHAVEQWLFALLGVRHEAPVLGLVFGTVLVLEPLLLLGAAAWIFRQLTGSGETMLRIAMRYAYSLVPLGFGVWLSHYLFHLATGALTFVPVVQSLLERAGVGLLGPPDWTLGGLPAPSVLPFELGFLGLGFVVTLAVTWRLALVDAPSRVGRAFLPWACLHSLLLATATWLLFQPMEMRGTFLSMTGLSMTGLS